MNNTDQQVFYKYQEEMFPCKYFTTESYWPVLVTRTFKPNIEKELANGWFFNIQQFSIYLCTNLLNNEGRLEKYLSGTEKNLAMDKMLQLPRPEKYHNVWWELNT